MLNGYCAENPDQKSVATIVSDVQDLLSGLTEDMEIDEDLAPATVDEVLKVFPDAQRACVQGLLRSYRGQLAAVIEAMAEQGYDKELAGSSSDEGPT